MRNSMIVEYPNEKFQHFICACSDCRPEPSDTIPKFYSHQQAKEKGWRATKHHKYCEPGKDFAYVCPDCWKRNEEETHD